MPVLLSSRDIFLSTQQSGAIGTAESSFDKFRMCMNTSPITCDNGQMIKLGLAQFYANRSFYLINKFNNRVDIYAEITQETTTSSVEYIQRAVYLQEGDYGTIKDIQDELADKICAALRRFGMDATDMAYIVDSNANPTFDKKLDIKITRVATGTDNLPDGTEANVENVTDGSAKDARVTKLRIVCPQWHSSDPTSFNESYIILGGKRITNNIYDVIVDDADYTSDYWFDSTNRDADTFANDIDYVEDSFDIKIVPDASGVDVITIKGYFPMELKTNNFVYLKCHESGSNMMSQNLNSSHGLAQDTHMLSTPTLAKIPVSDGGIAVQFDSDSPYFLFTSNQHISEILFELVDHHGRPIPKPLLVVDTDSNASHASANGHICDFNEDAKTPLLTPNQYSLLDYKTNKAYFHTTTVSNEHYLTSGSIVSETDPDYDIQKHGSMFNDMVLKVEIYATGGNEHTLKAPTQDFNYLKNTTSQVQSFFPH